MKVYTAIGELKVSDDSAEGHVTDPTGAHAASAVSADSGTLVGVGTDVQAVLEELDNAIVAATHDPVTVGTGLDVAGQLVTLDLSEVASGGELGGNMDAPTVDATHSGSTHAAAQAAAEATAAAAAATHAGAADPHTGYLKESVLAGPGNADPLADATAAAAGAATWASREDHVHPDTKLATHAAAADPHTGYLKESNTIDFLVGTATAELAGEIVVGATPGGELGNTWASPTVDASHAGSTHAAAQAAAEATAAAAAATHAGAADPHTGYLKESATIDFLVGTAHGDLASEIVVGATPGGELGGTWASPTVAATHSGSAHHAQAHGAADHADITRSLWVPIPGAADTGTFAYLGTAPDRTAVINLADGATSGFPITFTVPADWAGGALSFKWFIGGSTNFGAADTVRIQTSFLEVANSAVTTGAGAGATTNVDPGTGYLANELFIWTDPTTITPAAVNNYIRGFIQRIGANAADDYTGIMRVFGLRVDYTANQ